MLRVADGDIIVKPDSREIFGRRGKSALHVIWALPKDINNKSLKLLIEYKLLNHASYPCITIANYIM